MVIVMDCLTLKLVFMVDKTEQHVASSEGGKQTNMSNCADCEQKKYRNNLRIMHKCIVLLVQKATRLHPQT